MTFSSHSFGAFFALVLPVAACSLTLDGGYSELSLAEELAPLGDSCSSCLKQRCEHAFDACSEQESCASYAACRNDREGIGIWTCGALDEDYMRLLECSACADECGFGQHFECVGRFDWPKPASDTVHFRQQVLDTVTGTPFAGVSVAVCPARAVDCPDSELVQGVTDEQGWYDLHLPVQDTPRPRSEGFRGVFRLTSDELPTYHLQLGRPIFVDTVEWVYLFRKEWLDLISEVGLSLDPKKAHLMFQAFDCLALGAEGIEVEVEQSTSTAHYLQDKHLTLTTIATVNAGGGMGIVPNLEGGVGTLYSVRAREHASGRVYSEATIALRPGEIGVLQLQAGSGSELAPW